MAEERIGGVYVEAYVKGLEEAERRLRDLEARASAVGAGGAGGGGASGGGGYHVGGTTGGTAPPSGGGFHVGSSRPPTGDPLRSNPLLDDVFWGPQSPAGASVPGGGRSGGGPPPDKPVGTFGGWGGGRSRPPSMPQKWIDASGPDIPSAKIPGFYTPPAESPPEARIPGFYTPKAGTPMFAAVEEARQKRIKEQLAQAGENAGEKLGLRAAWIIRSATGGGALGAAGGGLGALAGLAAGNPQFGALVGNFAAQKLGDMSDASDAMMAKAGKAFPGLGLQRMRAEADAEAAEGRAYVETYKRRTKIEKDWADFYASGGKSATGALGQAFGDLGTAASRRWMEILGKAQGVTPTPGSGVGAAMNAMMGQKFSSGQEVYAQWASSMIRNSATPAGGGSESNWVWGAIGMNVSDRAAQEGARLDEIARQSRQAPRDQGWMSWLYTNFMP